MLSDIPFDFKRFKIKSTTLKKKLKKKEIITFELSEHTYKNWSETDDLHVLHVDIVSSSCYKTVVYLWPFNNVYIFVSAHNMIKNSFSLIRLLLLDFFFFLTNTEKIRTSEPNSINAKGMLFKITSSYFSISLF